MKHNPKNLSIFHLPHFTNTVKNYAIVSASIFLICSLSVGIFQRFVYGREYEPLDIAYGAANMLDEKIQDYGEDVNIASPVQWGEEEGQVAGYSDENTQNQVE